MRIPLLVAFTSADSGRVSGKKVAQTLDRHDWSGYVARLPQKWGGFEEGGHKVSRRS